MSTVSSNIRDNCKRDKAARFLPNATTKQKTSLTTLVDHILDARATNPAADVSALEADIDRLVYDLYGLTAPEIAIEEEKSI